MTSKPERKITLRDKLSRLTYLQAVKLLGDQGKLLTAVEKCGAWR